MYSAYRGSERRKSARVKAEFIVVYKVNRPIEVYMWIGNKKVSALMVDLSDLGMAVLTDYNIPKSTILSIKFTLINLHADDDERVRPMEVIGEVRDNNLVKKYTVRLGICFTQVSEADKEAITKYVKMTTKR